MGATQINSYLFPSRPKIRCSLLDIPMNHKYNERAFYQSSDFFTLAERSGKLASFKRKREKHANKRGTLRSGFNTFWKQRT